MAHSSSSSESSSTSFQFGFTELEQLLQGVNMEIVRQQLGALAMQFGFQDQALSLVPELRDQLAEGMKTSPEQQALNEKQISAQSEMLDRELERIRRGPGASDEQKRLINESTEAQIARGRSDIEAFGRDQLDIITQELAPSRGLRPSDSPIQDRGFKLGGELTRQYGSLVSDLRGQQAQAELNFPLAANESQSGLNQFQQQLAQSAGNFQSQLGQQAFSNRLSLFGQVGQMGLGLIGSAQPQAQLQETFRPQLGTETTSKSKSSSRSLL